MFCKSFDSNCVSGLLPISNEVRTRLHASNRASTFFKTISKNPLCSSMEDIAASCSPDISIIISPVDAADRKDEFLWPADCHNLLLDPGILDDTETQALLLVLLVCKCLMRQILRNCDILVYNVGIVGLINE